MSAAVSIGSGGPFGAEGPIVMTGGAFGSLIAQFFLSKLTREKWKFSTFQRVLGGLILMDATMSVFGSYNAMMVIFAREVFRVGPAEQGLLQGAAGLGSVGSVRRRLTSHRNFSLEVGAEPEPGRCPPRHWPTRRRATDT